MMKTRLLKRTGLLVILCCFLFFSLTCLGADNNLKDGAYTVDVILEGGSGKASVTSPALLMVKDQQMKAQIEWNSPSYDYMILDGETYFPVNQEGNSVFEIPVGAFDQPVRVTADTTAMSMPHEIEYTLTYVRDSVKPISAEGEKQRWKEMIPVGCAAGAGALLCVYYVMRRKKDNEKKG